MQMLSYFRNTTSQDTNLGYFYVLFSMLNSQCASTVKHIYPTQIRPPKPVDYILLFLNAILMLTVGAGNMLTDPQVMTHP